MPCSGLVEKLRKLLEEGKIYGYQATSDEIIILVPPSFSTEVFAEEKLKYRIIKIGKMPEALEDDNR
jgi:hypothetical protein